MPHVVITLNHHSATERRSDWKYTSKLPVTVSPFPSVRARSSLGVSLRSVANLNILEGTGGLVNPPFGELGAGAPPADSAVPVVVALASGTCKSFAVSGG